MLRILVAEDSDSARFLMCEVLRRAGYEPCPARDGVEALEVMEHYQCDLAVVDITMPRMDGIAATRRIIAEYPSTRVLILTTFDLDEYVYDALRAGASGFLLKDVQAARLIEAVRMVADGSMLLGPSATRRLVEDLADQGAVHVGLGHDVDDVAGLHRAAVLDAHRVRGGRADEFADPGADRPADLLGVLGGGHLAGADRPDRLVGHHRRGQAPCPDPIQHRPHRLPGAGPGHACLHPSPDCRTRC